MPGSEVTLILLQFDFGCVNSYRNPEIYGAFTPCENSSTTAGKMNDVRNPTAKATTAPTAIGLRLVSVETESAFRKALSPILLNLSIVDLLWQVIGHITTLTPGLFAAFCLPLAPKNDVHTHRLNTAKVARGSPGDLSRCTQPRSRL